MKSDVFKLLSAHNTRLRPLESCPSLLAPKCQRRVSPVSEASERQGIRSSTGRAPAFQVGGCGFESRRVHILPAGFNNASGGSKYERERHNPYGSHVGLARRRTGQTASRIMPSRRYEPFLTAGLHFSGRGPPSQQTLPMAETMGKTQQPRPL